MQQNGKKLVKRLSENKEVPTKPKGKAKRVLVIGDLHCGHKTGLTPPRYQDSEQFKWGISQHEAWDWYSQTVKNNGPYDLCICNGDAIAGHNDRQGGTQLITTDCNAQVSMALACLEATKCKTFRLTYGTGYHTGATEDWELTLCKRLVDKGHDAKIDAEGFYDVNGVIISAKHHMMGSAQDSLRGTPLLKEGLYNDQWVTQGIQPHADIIVRGHVHFFERIETTNRILISCPALCTLGDKYGARICKGVVHFGLVVIDISHDGNVQVRKYIETLNSQPDYAEVI